MADAFKKILANRCAFFFAHRFTIPTNQASHGMIWSEDTGIACEVFAWSGDLHGQTFEKLASSHRDRSGAITAKDV
jgi:hypothetical protein